MLSDIPPVGPELDSYFYALQDKHTTETAFARAITVAHTARQVRESGETEPHTFHLNFSETGNVVLVTVSTTEPFAEVLVPFPRSELAHGVDRYPVAGLSLLFTLAERIPDLGGRIEVLIPTHPRNFWGILISLVAELDQ